MKPSPNASDIPTRVLAISGVTNLFPPSGSITRFTDPGIAGIGHSGQVWVETTPDGTNITARIGVTATRPVPDTARQVADMLRDTTPGATVNVQITRIA